MTTDTEREQLREEAATIAKARPDVIQPQGRIGTHTSIHATNAAVRTEIVCDSLQVRLSRDGLLDEQNLYLDAATAHALFQELDAVVEVCAACRKPGFKDVDVERCAVVGDWVHNADFPCHRSLCDGPTHDRECAS